MHWMNQMMPGAKVRIHATASEHKAPLGMCTTRCAEYMGTNEWDMNLSMTSL